MMQDKRELMRAAGFSEAEIDAELGPKRPTVRVAAESSSMQGPGKAPARASQDLAYVKGLARQGAQGASLGFADEIEARVRALFGGRRTVTSLITGEPKGYTAIRDQIRAENDAFAAENPKAALAANIAGGLLTGSGVAGAAKGAGTLGRVARVVSPKLDATAGVTSRALQAAKVGGIMGSIGGAGVAQEPGDMFQGALTGGLVGAVGGGLLAGAGDAFRGARNVAAQIGQKSAQAGPVRQFIQAETPEIAGARRVLRTMGRGGQSLDDLETAVANAPRGAALAEVIPEEQGVRALRISRNVGREGGTIDKALAERAGEAPSRYAEVIAKNTGVPEGLDAKTVGEKAFAAVEPRYNDLVTKAYAQPDVSAQPILRSVEKLSKSKSGNAALTRAKELSEGFDAVQNIDPANPVISVQNAHYLRQGLDHAINEAEKAGDAQMVRILMGERNTVDRFVKKAGGKMMQRADRLWESAANAGESFAEGQQSQLATTRGRMVALKANAKDPEAFRRGAASKQLERIEATPDGVSGQTRNPTVGTMGSPTARARASLGYQDRAAFGNAQDEAATIVDQLRTRQAVSGNSATARNQAEMMDEFMTDPGAVAGAVVNPTVMPRVLIERLMRGGAQGLNAVQADEMGRLLRAGLPGQMRSADAVRKLRELEPAITAMMTRQALIRGGAGGMAGRGAAGNSGGR